jgi:hypothetical protein
MLETRSKDRERIRSCIGWSFAFKLWITILRAALDIAGKYLHPSPLKVNCVPFSEDQDQ